MKLFAMVTRLTFCAIVGANVEAEYAWFCRQYFLWRYPPVFGVNLCNRWTSPRIEEAAGASTWSSRFMISLVMRLTAHVQHTWEMCLIATKNSLLMILYINKTSRCESWKTTVKPDIETDSSVCFHAGGWFSVNYLSMLATMTAFNVDPYNGEVEIHESISSTLLISNFWSFLFIGMWQPFWHSYICIPLACANAKLLELLFNPCQNWMFYLAFLCVVQRWAFWLKISLYEHFLK